MEWQERHLGASARGLMPVQMSVSRVHPSFGAFLPAGLLRLNLMLPITRLFSAISPPYRDRVQLYNFDIWSKSVDLMIEARGYRDGRDWTRQVPKRAQPANTPISKRSRSMTLSTLTLSTLILSKIQDFRNSPC
jgi:hypothetical protein